MPALFIADESECRIYKHVRTHLAHGIVFRNVEELRATLSFVGNFKFFLEDKSEWKLFSISNSFFQKFISTVILEVPKIKYNININIT